MTAGHHVSGPVHLRGEQRDSRAHARRVPDVAYATTDTLDVMIVGKVDLVCAIAASRHVQLR